MHPNILKPKLAKVILLNVYLENNFNANSVDLLLSNILDLKVVLGKSLYSFQHKEAEILSKLQFFL